MIAIRSLLDRLRFAFSGNVFFNHSLPSGAEM
jgi:hypothetical protein